MITTVDSPTLIRRAGKRGSRDLLPTYLGCDIGRVKSGIRRLIGAIVGASFALSAFTWGWMPGCGPAQAMSPHGTHHHSTAPGQPGKSSANLHCVVHLCCSQLIAPPAGTSAPERLEDPVAASRLSEAGSYLLLRPSHALPFGQAPPPNLI
jgi:hypothetical protein